MKTLDVFLIVRRQMVWDNLLGFGTEALVHMVAS